MEFRGARFVERRAQRETPWKIGVGDEQLSEGDGIGLAGFDCFLGGFEREFFIDDVHAAEGRLELRMRICARRD
jgi:predicted deacetylase